MIRKHYNAKRLIETYGKCVYCESKENLTVDHIIAISRRHEYNIPMRQIHNYGNLVVACKNCNEEKAEKRLEYFFNEHPEYKKRFLRNAKYINDKVRRICLNN